METSEYVQFIISLRFYKRDIIVQCHLSWGVLICKQSHNKRNVIMLGYSLLILAISAAWLVLQVSSDLYTELDQIKVVIIQPCLPNTHKMQQRHNNNAFLGYLFAASGQMAHTRICSDVMNTSWHGILFTLCEDNPPVITQFANAPIQGYQSCKISNFWWRSAVHVPNGANE